MRRLIALLSLLGVLTACAAPGAPADSVPAADVSPAEEAADAVPHPGTMGDTVTFSQAAPEQLTYTVVLETLEDAALAEDGTELVRQSCDLPVMTVELADGTALTEASTPAEEAALAAAETFNSQFSPWAASDGLEELAAVAEEDRTFRTENGFPWNPHAVELNCSVYQTEQMVSIQAEYYTYTGGAHPNTMLMAWNFDLTTGQFFTPEQLAADGQVFLETVAEALLRQGRETAAAYDMAPEDFFWTNYQEIIAGWSSYAVSFDGEGMTVGFSPYELAAYAAGAQIYHLPYEQLAGYFSAHGLALLGLSAAEK